MLCTYTDATDYTHITHSLAVRMTKHGNATGWFSARYLTRYFISLVFPHIHTIHPVHIVSTRWRALFFIPPPIPFIAYLHLTLTLYVSLHRAQVYYAVYTARLLLRTRLYYTIYGGGGGGGDGDDDDDDFTRGPTPSLQTYSSRQRS